METKYWRVTLKDRSKADVTAEYVKIDGQNNLQFRIEDEAQPVVVFHRGEWRAFTQIDKLGGKLLWMQQKIERQHIYKTDKIEVGWVD